MMRIARNTGLNLIATGFAVLTGFAGSIISARLLGPSAYGVFSLLAWLFTTLILQMNSGLSTAIQKFVSELEGAGQRPVANTLTLGILTLQGIIGTIAGILLVTQSSWLAAILGQTSAQPYLAVLGFGIPIAMTLDGLRSRLGGFQRYDLISLVSIISASFVLTGTILVLRYNFGVGGLVQLTVGVYIFQFFVFTALVWKRYRLWPIKPMHSFLVWRVIRLCAGVFVITLCDAVIWQRAGTFFLGRLSTLDQIAYYGVAYNFSGMTVIMLVASISSVLMPAISHHFGAGNRNEMQRIYRTAIKYVGMISLPLYLGGFAIATPLVGVLYGTNYSAVIGPLRILLIGSMVGALGAPGSALLLALDRAYLKALWLFPIAAINVLVTIFLVPTYGAIGAATASMVCQVLAISIELIYLLHYRKFQLPFALFLRTVLAACISAIFAYIITIQISGMVGLLIAILFGAGIYVAALIITGTFISSDFALLRRVGDRLPLRVGKVFKSIVGFMEVSSLKSSLLFERDQTR